MTARTAHAIWRYSESVKQALAIVQAALSLSGEAEESQREAVAVELAAQMVNVIAATQMLLAALEGEQFGLPDPKIEETRQSLLTDLRREPEPGGPGGAE